MRGRFITFEGGEGSGKSTQVRHLKSRLEQLGHSVVATREPGGTPYAEDIRELLLSGATKKQGPDAEAILVTSARFDHVRSVIKPALAAGQWVICDRFADSTLAYQGILDGGDLPFILDLNASVMAECRPDLTFVLDLPAQDVSKRLSSRADTGDRYDDQAMEQHDTVRRAFLAIAKDEPDRVAVINARASEEAVAAAVWDVVAKRLSTSRVAGSHGG